MKKHIEIKYQNLILRGYLDYVSATDCIIVVHGIGGNKLGNKFIFNQFAKVANDNQLSTLRIDFAGTGESDGEYINTDHLDQANQLETIYNYAKEILQFENIHLLGTSIGCLVILQSLKLSNNQVRSVTLWNPNIDIAGYTAEFGQSGVEMDMGGLILSDKYVDNLGHLNIDYDFSKYPIIILHGTKDYNYNNQFVSSFCDSNNCEFVAIEGGDHLFESTQVRADLFASSVDFINKNRD